MCLWGTVFSSSYCCLIEQHMVIVRIKVSKTIILMLLPHACLYLYPVCAIPLLHIIHMSFPYISEINIVLSTPLQPPCKIL